MSAGRSSKRLDDRAWDALADALDAFPREAVPLLVAGDFDMREWAERELRGVWSRPRPIREVVAGSDHFELAPRGD